MKKSNLPISISIVILLTLTLAIPGLPAQIDRGAAVPSEGIPEKLRGLDIKDYFIGSGLKRVGSIDALRGSVVVTHKATGEAYFGLAGDYLYKNDALETLPHSRCRIDLVTEDVISMAANTRLELDEVSFEREKRSFLGMLKGKVMFYALRLFSRKTNMQVRTPTAVCGVRGTKFAVHVYKLQEEAAAGEVVLATLGDSIPFLAAVDNEKTGMDVIFYDGPGYIDGERIGPGQKYGNGIIREATTEEMEALEQDTWVDGKLPPPVKATVRPRDTGKRDPSYAPDTPDRIADENQKQVIGGEEQSPATGGLFGYFTALLSNAGEGYSYAGTYTSTSRQDFGGETVEAYSNGDKMVTTGKSAWGGGTPYLKSINHAGFSSGDLGATRPIVIGELGKNAYLTWGWWNCPGSVSINPLGDYAVSHPSNAKQGYYIFGPNPADIGALSGAYTYTGSAHGTIQRLNVLNQDMQGSFNCSLNFDTQQVADFDLSVSGGGYAASIANAAGSLMAGDNHINLNAGFGWKLGIAGSETAATSGVVKGSVYGDGGEAVGGVWNMGNAEAYHATGIFQGVK
ncbi:MAG TPA: FecR family protein [Desulfatiglandales bacterium]|nr:FecR family protein [Desulfatiglandales bacterium]